MRWLLDSVLGPQNRTQGSCDYNTLHYITGYTLLQTSQQCITLSKIGSRHKRIYLLEPKRLHISFTQKVPDCIIQQQTIIILTFRQCSDASPSCSVLMKGFSIQCNHYSSLGHFWSSWGFWGFWCFRHFDTLTLLYSGPQRWAGSTVFLKIKWSGKEGRVRRMCPKTEPPVPGIECLWWSINCVDKKLALIDQMIPGPARRRECRQWTRGRQFWHWCTLFVNRLFGEEPIKTFLSHLQIFKTLY